MAWTKEQIDAIEKSGTNIIVSAGAGSGKTAVLSERVINKLENGIHINELLILTFTNAAAAEMKDRIRKKISNNPKYKDELKLIDSAYITTFDSFALSMLKKYHYLLNISNDIKITDESFVSIKESEILDNIFEELYEKHDNEFELLIDKYCIKNDKVLRANILKVARRIDSFIDKYEYLEYLRNDYFNNIDYIIEDYKKLIDDKRNVLKLELENLKYYFDSNYVDSIYSSCTNILECDYDSLTLIDNVRLPNVPRNSSEESKKAKSNVKNAIDDLLKNTCFGTIEDIKNNIFNNKNNIITIVDIVYEYIERLSKYKLQNNIYTFSDIAYLSIKILKENKFVCDELRNSFKEIMIDEYQDTNDIQDTFISLISNNNVYMVGDIKQSIYRFRGSNPDIFKYKYEKYSNNEDGIKIDLIKNFRSRSEVLSNINSIFELIMDFNLGGAAYKESHEMIYGNTLYDEQSIKDYNYDIDIFEYNREKDCEYSEQEIEMFAIARDIKNKINSGFQVFDKNTSLLRKATYNDFVIILDRSKFFDDYKKVFEYLGIPLTILKDEILNTSYDLLLIKNIFDFVIKINNEEYDVDFKYDFISIARSFLYEYSDQYIFDVFKNDSYKETTIYKDFSSINNINSITSSELLLKIIDITSFYEKLNKIGDYERANVRINNIYNLCTNLNDLGICIDDFKEYMENILDNGIDIKYSAYNDSKDSVKIMTIHKSKGLEYPVCYFADLNHKFNIKDTTDLFIVDKRYGLVVPNILDDKDNSLIKTLFKYSYMKEEISEKLRLFYVALTRAREKIIIVIPNSEEVIYEKNDFGVIEEIRRLSFNKLSDFIYGIKHYLNKYFENLDINELDLTKGYLYKRKIDNKISSTQKEFIVEEININNNSISEEHFSKESINLINKTSYDNMKFGTKVHESLEYLDFNNYDESIIEDKYIRNKINKFMNNPILKDIKDARIYHEYEFIYKKDNVNYHGIVDLILEYSDHIDIIDYKLKNVDDEKYIDQLNGYKSYIESISSKPINLYLYSILDEEFKNI